MPKYIRRSFLFIVSIYIIFPLYSQAKSSLTNDADVFQFIQNAFLAQVSLSEKGRNLSEIDQILTSYFAEEAKEKFLEENLFEENGQYITFGTDFPIYYIPFFSYEDETEVIWMDEYIYVIEHFGKKEDGPVTYDDHYQGVLLKKESGIWKVVEFLYDIPPDDLNQLIEEVDAPVVPIKDERLSTTVIFGKSSFYYGNFSQPVTNLYLYGYSILTSFSKNL